MSVSNRVKWHRKLHRIGDAVDWTCHYCGKCLECKKCHRKTDVMATRDHVIPKSKGGQNGYENLVLACLSCNGKKGSRSLDRHLNLAPRNHLLTPS